MAMGRPKGSGSPRPHKYLIERVINRGWEYLDRNFSQFSEDKKLLVALELCKKSMPKEIVMKGEVTHTVKVEPFDIEERATLLCNGRN